jgi:hypothetical protein
MMEDTTPRSRGRNFARAFCKNFALSKKRAQGMPDAPSAPAASYAKVESIRVSHHRFAETFRHSLHNGLTAYTALSSVSRAFLPPSPVDHLDRLDTSVGVSGPRSLTIHNGALRQTRPYVHRIPRPTSVTIAKRPSCEARDGRDSAGDLGLRSMLGACGTLARRANQM